MEHRLIGRLAVVVVLWVGRSTAITWSFDREGDRQGWHVVADFLSDRLAPDQGAVAGGRWSIRPDRATLHIASPRIGYDSALFDRVTVRFRVVHVRPFESGWQLRWTNVHNATLPGWDPLLWAADLPPGKRPPQSRFRVPGGTVSITTGWQEVTLSDLRSRSVLSTDTAYEVVWEDTLIDIRLDIGVWDKGDLAESFEIDRIVLTGVGELLQGELDPPEPDTVRQSYGTLFSPATFVSVRKPGVQTNGTPAAPPGALGDLDGDGDLDLVALWGTEQAGGWLYALGDGAGSFGRAVVFTVGASPSTGGASPAGGPTSLWGRDLNGDGTMDLVLAQGYTTRLLASARQDSPGALREIQSIEGLWPLGLGDGNGDGRADLWLADFAEGQERAVFGRNEGTGHLRLQEVPLVRPRPGFLPMTLLAHGLGRDGVDGVVWGAMPSPGAGLEVTYLAADEQIEQLHVPAALDLNLIHYVGDLDGDQDLDLLVSDEVIAGAPPRFLGMRCLLSQADGSILEQRLTADMQPRSGPAVADLNGDGRLDVAFVDGTARDPAVGVALGQAGGAPVLEGRYPLEGPGGAVLHGDLDGDGDTDLAVLESSLSGEGGVHVLLNRMSERGTAVAADGEGSALGTSAAHPAAPRLLPAFPNPFNPHTTLSIEVPGPAADVELRIYDTLGRPLRVLLYGSVSPGRHAVIWDGRDDQGREVAAGVYLCRLRAGGASQVQKVVRVQ
ncbi:MAG: FG-GAP-like repeat-containing protein [Candidatus Latescibacterota bacterium]